MFLDRKDLFCAGVVLFFVWVAHMITPAHSAEQVPIPKPQRQLTSPLFDVQRPRAFPTHDATPYAKALWAGWCSAYFEIKSRQEGYADVRHVGVKASVAAYKYLLEYNVMGARDKNLSRSEAIELLIPGIGAMERSRQIDPQFEEELCMRFAYKYRFRWENAFVPETSS